MDYSDTTFFLKCRPTVSKTNVLCVDCHQWIYAGQNVRVHPFFRVARCSSCYAKYRAWARRHKQRYEDRQRHWDTLHHQRDYLAKLKLRKPDVWRDFIRSKILGQLAMRVQQLEEAC